MLLNDLKLRLHDFQQQMNLLGDLAGSPNHAKPRKGRQHQQNQAQPPCTIDRENGSNGPRRRIQKGRKQDAGEDDEETRNRLPRQKDCNASGQQREARREEIATIGSRRISGAIVMWDDPANPTLSWFGIGHGSLAALCAQSPAAIVRMLSAAK